MEATVTPWQSADDWCLFVLGSQATSAALWTPVIAPTGDTYVETRRWWGRLLRSCDLHLTRLLHALEVSHHMKEAQLSAWIGQSLNVTRRLLCFAFKSTTSLHQTLTIHPFGSISRNEDVYHSHSLGSFIFSMHLTVSDAFSSSLNCHIGADTSSSITYCLMTQWSVVAVKRPTVLQSAKKKSEPRPIVAKTRAR